MTTKRKISFDELSEKDSSSSEQSGSSPPKLVKPEDVTSPTTDATIDATPVHHLRVSARVLRKKFESALTEDPSDEVVAAVSSGLANGHEEGDKDKETQKQKRAWELWSADDKNTFFEALNECGKNFDAMQLFFHNKSLRRKSSDSVFKHKEQIRTFYYRTWHKISKHVQFPESLKKSSRELYGLINYGELRKKIGSNLDEKNGAKLQELIFRGHTTIRIKGKTMRLRTPTCPALKRLSDALASTGKDLDGSQRYTADHPFPLPKSILLHLTPATREDFHRVHFQSLSNPNVCVKLGLQRRLISVIEFLEKKWRPLNEKLRQQCYPLLSPNCDQNATSPSCADLWIVPKEGCTFSQLVISPVEPTTSATLSLSHLQSKLEPKEDNAPASAGSATSTPSVVADKTEASFVLAQPSLPPVGWSRHSAQQVTLGELYLQLGSSSKDQAVLHLHYTWKPSQPDSKLPVSSASHVMSMLAKWASNEIARKQCATRVSPTIMLQAVTNSAGGPPTSESEFRRPAVPAATRSLDIRKQLDILLPKSNQRKGRPFSRSKSFVRMIRPLVPKILPNVVTSSGQVKLCLMPLQSSSSSTITVTHPVVTFVPAFSAVATPNQSSHPIPQMSIPSPPSMSAESVSYQNQDSLGAALSLFDKTLSDIEESAAPGQSASHHFFDSVLENSNSSLLQTPKRQTPSPALIPSPPPSGYAEQSWLPELSLSSFLNLNESIKGQPPPQFIINDDSIQSTGSEVDRHFLSMLNDSSVDFTAKFEKLASAINGNDLLE